jgi:surface polysaccharide O-acyltransferase-like enzyme
MASRIAVVFCAWSAIYLWPTNTAEVMALGPLGLLKVIQTNLLNTLQDPATAIFQGTKGHLWFLPSLLCCLAISAILLSRNMERSLVAVSIVLYGVGLAGKAYSDTPIGFVTRFNFRNGPFFGLVFFVTGYLLQHRGPQDSRLRYGLLLTGCGTCIHFIEIFVLNKYWGTALFQDYVVGTYFSGVGLALIALSNSPLLRFRFTSLVGPLVLGIYAIHVLFIDLLSPIDELLSGNAIWAACFPVVVFFLSVFATYALSRVPLTRRIVI